MSNSTEELTLAELLALPPAILDTIPALAPPEGLQSNFVNPQSKGYILNAVATFLFGLAVLFYAVRVYSKTRIVRMTSWDDGRHAFIKETPRWFR